MRSKTRNTVIIFTALAALAVSTSSALALYPQGSARLSGPAIGGVTPEGDAKFDQSRYPSVPPRLDVRVKNVNLPDGTELFVGLGCEFHQCVDYRRVGSFTLSGRSGALTASLRVSVGRQDLVMVSTADGTVVLKMTEPWKV